MTVIAGAVVAGGDVGVQRIKAQVAIGKWPIEREVVPDERVHTLGRSSSFVRVVVRVFQPDQPAAQGQVDVREDGDALQRRRCSGIRGVDIDLILVDPQFNVIHDARAIGR